MPLPTRRLTTMAIIRPNRPMLRKLPMDVRSRLVTWPYTLIPANIPAAMKNA